MAFWNKRSAQETQSREYLENRFRSARRSLLSVAIFTVINLVLLVTNSNTYFVFSAFIPYFLTGMGMMLCGRFPAEYYGEEFSTLEFLPPVVLTVAIAISVVILTLYLAAWYFSKNRNKGWLIFAFVAFALDTLIMFLLSENLVSSILDIVFHAWVLFDIGVAISVAGKIKQLPDEETACSAAATEEAGTIAPEALIDAMNKVNNGGDASDLETIVEDYFLILKSLHKGGKPEQVVLSDEDFSCVIVDGQEYDLYTIPHNNEDDTNRRMEIEVLLNENTPVSLVQEKLNEYIREHW